MAEGHTSTVADQVKKAHAVADQANLDMKTEHDKHHADLMKKLGKDGGKRRRRRKSRKGRKSRRKSRKSRRKGRKSRRRTRRRRRR